MKYSGIIQKLKDCKADSPQSEAFLLLEHFFGVKPADVLAYPERNYTSAALDSALIRRALGEPVQYITGIAGFYGLKFKVNKSCLIPRFDTEVLCDFLIKKLPAGARVLEFCTGSGCIPIAIAKNRADVTLKSIELYSDTVKTAEENRKLNGIPPSQLEIVCADALMYDCSGEEGVYDAVISNPPYIPSKAVPSLSREVLFEPRAALDGGRDGLDFYRQFLSFSEVLKPGGFFAFEIGYDQGESITELAAKAGFKCRLLHDLEKRDRVAVIEKSSGKQ